MIVTTRVEVVDADGARHEVPVRDLSWSEDGAAAVPRTLRLAVEDEGWLPATDDDLLAPGRTLLPAVTVDGVEHPLGRFVIDTASSSETPEGITITVPAMDVASDLHESSWADPHSIPEGTPLADAVEGIIRAHLPDAVVALDPVAWSTPGLLFLPGSQSPLADARNLAQAGGRELRTDRSGTWRLYKVPDTTRDAPSWTVVDGDSGTLEGLDRELTRARSYRRVDVRGEHPSLISPVRAVREDPTSASRRTFFLASPAISSQEQADDAAETLLKRLSGIYETVGFSALPNLAVQVGTVGLVSRVPFGVHGVYAAEQVALDAGAEVTMRASLRVQAA